MSDALPVYLIHWDAPEWLRSSVDTILASDRPVSITVIDNGPAAASAELDLPDSCNVIQTGANLGYTGGANTALRHWLGGDAPYCVLGAHDLHVQPTDLRLMVDAAEASPSFGILGPGTGEGYDAGYPLGESEGLEERTTMNGTCLVLRRDCIRQIGLFDEQFGSYGEDDELCFRARRAGWKVGRVPGTYARGVGSRAVHHQKLRGRARVLLLMKTEGRAAAIRRLARSLIGLLMSVPCSLLSRECRSEIMRSWCELRYGMPLLLTRLRDPPSAE
jgi:N-acetylglucosaminyl-diphospho-decaprenol L-rhamnosyltransferase